MKEKERERRRVKEIESSMKRVNKKERKRMSTIVRERVQ